ncbi:Tetratricopeptide repeat protein 36 [Choanephora cucurbitarum]|uniref:Tetratricopeptide repeat protein 36 n=1 Tax=Choanephora cucurbitarum TaxID=101091 RepID=A0A1C7NHG4_9FUNG|nr:Tetratricopeptide repeat protein 36 [Choanephora cucurbitarum]
MSISDDAVLEFMFNPENQGLPLDAISCTVDSNPKYTFSDETLAKLESMEKEAVVLVEKDQDTEKALSILNQCIDMEKNYASAYNNRAQIYRMKNKLDEALQDLNFVIEDAGEGQPKILRQAYTQRAVIKRQQGDVVGSRKDFEIGAKLGNPLARQIAVNENPYAKMCNQVMMEVMNRERMMGE